MYVAAVQTVFSLDYLDPEKTSDLSDFSNAVQLKNQYYASMYII